jgi:light-regulated signal transduction histidine kinase (bacteriophytochrome)
MSQPPGDPKLPWGYGPYSIKRHGTMLATCDSEPVQTPGCIQAHGALLVLRLGDLQILQASENTLAHLGEEARSLLGQPVARVIGTGHAAHLSDMLARDTLDRGAAYAFTLPARAGMAALDVCLHTSRGVAVLEFEGTGRTEKTGRSTRTGERQQ